VVLSRVGGLGGDFVVAVVFGFGWVEEKMSSSGVRGCWRRFGGGEICACGVEMYTEEAVCFAGLDAGRKWFFIPVCRVMRVVCW
jgi:hypothetical protein